MVKAGDGPNFPYFRSSQTNPNKEDAKSTNNIKKMVVPTPRIELGTY